MHIVANYSAMHLNYLRFLFRFKKYASIENKQTNEKIVTRL